MLFKKKKKESKAQKKKKPLLSDKDWLEIEDEDEEAEYIETFMEDDY
ncbi:MAG: hypothetical protein MJ217_01100 [Bacilli bacterium]|nr:hypothetical protein [Bacilli bacterium]